MDAGLGSMTVLKRALLPQAQWLPTTFDANILVIGLGVARSFDRYCDRKFSRGTHVDTFTGERGVWFLSSTPVESVTSVEEKTDETAGWATITNAYNNLETVSGRLCFGDDVSDYETLVRVTYVGGYWWDTTDELTDTLPAGATALPDEVKMAWLLQCQHQWSVRDKLGSAVAMPAGESAKLGDYDLLPDVKRILDSYIRYQIA